MNEQLNLELGRRLRRRRRLMSLTLQEVGERSGIRLQSVQKYETGANAISAAALWKLACALDVSPAYFFEGLAEPPLPAPRPVTRRDADMASAA